MTEERREPARSRGVPFSEWLTSGRTVSEVVALGVTICSYWERVPRRGLGAERVDLVTVDASQPVLAFEAISGRPIFTRSLHERAAFISLVSRVYEDVMVNLKKTLSYRRDS